MKKTMKKTRAGFMKNTKSLIMGSLEILFSLILGVAFVFTFALYTLIGFFIAILIMAIFFIFVYQMSKISVDWNILLFIIGGFIVGIIVGSIIFASFASINQYPISMQVFYPNHPNITITQNCTTFSNSASGYINGNPINPQNTTECNLPQSMAHPNNYNYYNPFTCSIIGKNITCNSSGLDGINENATWKGTILNVSVRKWKYLYGTGLCKECFLLNMKKKN